MALSDKQKIEIILRKKEDIRKATDAISEALVNPPENALLFIKKKLHRITSDLSIAVGFLDKSSKDCFYRIFPYIAHISAIPNIKNLHKNILYQQILETLCITLNALTIDFNKKPWKFSTEFEIGLRDLKAKIKAHK